MGGSVEESLEGVVAGTGTGALIGGTVDEPNAEGVDEVDGFVCLSDESCDDVLKDREQIELTGEGELNVDGREGSGTERDERLERWETAEGAVDGG